MQVFKISCREHNYKPLTIYTLVVKNNESVMFKMLEKLAKENNTSVFCLDVNVPDDLANTFKTIDLVIKSMFNIKPNKKLGFIKNLVVNDNRLIKLIRMAEYDKNIKVV